MLLVWTVGGAGGAGLEALKALLGAFCSFTANELLV